MRKTAAEAIAVLFLFALSSATPSSADETKTDETRIETRDGKLFDAGMSLEAPAEKAPKDLARLVPFLGDWDLELEIHQPGVGVLRSTGSAKITFMNRGHAVMERTRVADFDGQGHSMATMAFIAVNGQGVWTVGEGNSWAEAITLSSGGWEDEKLVVYDAMRPGGGATLLQLKRTYKMQDAQKFEMKLELSADRGQSWNPAMIRRYQKRTASEDFFPTRDDIGLAAPDRPAEAGQFDFLLGEFEADHWRKRQQNETRWRSNATAVHVLDGYALLEFSWFDTDVSLPDAATSILRIYNRSMRRWESLYLPNRSNAALYFGGVQEGDRIVLHPFAAQTSSNPLSQWIFYDVQADTYRWKWMLSVDRGKSFAPNWTIDFKRKTKTSPQPGS